MDAGFPLSGSVMTVSGSPAKNAQVVGRLSDSLLMAPGWGPCQPRIAGKHYLRDQFSQPVMRLTSHQAEAIRQAVVRVLGLPARIWLFGSRVDDTARGGDIDLLVETDAVLASRAEAICRLYGALVMALGDRRIDVLVKDGRTPAAPIFDAARRTGVLL